MATKKITDLTQLTDLDATDSFVVNDSGAGADKRVEFSDLQSEVLNGAAIGTSTAITELQVDNLNLNGNTISSTDTNGNVTIDPNGTGSTVLVGDLLVDDKIIHSGDTNTAIRFPSADTVTVETAGSERLRIDSSGNVGIGTTSPLSTLHLYEPTSYCIINMNAQTASSSSYLALRRENNIKAYIGCENNTGGGIIGTGAADAALITTTSTNPIIFAPNQSERVRVTTDGLTFNGDTAAANALDDYEEGTFTATLKGSVSDPTTPVTSTARYTKIGNKMFVAISFASVDTTGASGNVSVTGLPISPISFPFVGSCLTNLYDYPSTSTSPVVYLNNSTTLNFYVSGDSIGFQTLQHSAGAGRWLVFNITYFVA